MSGTARNIKHVDVTKKMGEFYLALGAFNKVAVEKILAAKGDASVLDHVIDDILNAACEIHDRQCQDGYYYDHDMEACVKLKNIIPGGGT